MKRILKTWLICAVIVVVFGVIIGTVLGLAAVKTGHELYILELLESIEDKYILVVTYLILLVLCSFVQIIIHELGHLVFGLMSGYKFVSFRIGSFVLIKQEGRFCIKRFQIPGTGGQCLMSPPEKKNGNFPYVLYLLGGVIFNLLSVAAVFAALEFTSIGGKSYLAVFGILGILTALTNGIPMKVGDLENDGRDIVTISKDPIAKDAFYLMLKVNALVTEGMDVKDIPYEWFILPEDARLDNSMIAYIRLMEYNWHMSNLDLESAYNCLISLEPVKDKLIGIYQYEIQCEELFHTLLSDPKEELVEKLHDKKLKTYLLMNRFMIDKQTLLYAYALLYNRDMEEAGTVKAKFEQMTKIYPIKGEIAGQRRLMEYIKKRGDETLLWNNG